MHTKEVCNSGVNNAVSNKVTDFYVKIYIFFKRLLSVTLKQEKRIVTFKTYDTELHIQIIYCWLIGCRSVATQPN